MHDDTTETGLDSLAKTPFHMAPDVMRSHMLGHLAHSALYLALSHDPRPDCALDVRLFQVERMHLALATDLEDRLSVFLGAPVPFAVLPGHSLAQLLCAQNLGLLVNPGQKSEMMLDPQSLAWIADAVKSSTAQAAPEETDLQLLSPDPSFVAKIIEPLALRLRDMGFLMAGAALVGTRHQKTNRKGHALLIAGTSPDNQGRIAQILAEALAFLPAQPGGVDITFSDAPPPKGAIRFELAPHESAATPHLEKSQGIPRLR